MRDNLPSFIHSLNICNFDSIYNLDKFTTNFSDFFLILLTKKNAKNLPSSPSTFREKTIQDTIIFSFAQKLDEPFFQYFFIDDYRWK